VTGVQTCALPILGSYGIYKDGWKATFRYGDPYGRRPDNGKQVLLYNVKEDFNELNDLSDKYPEKLRELEDAFDVEAWKYNVYPLRDKSWDISGEKNIFDGKNKLTLNSGAYLTTFSIPYFLLLAPYSVSADVEILNPKDEGVLVSLGGYVGGVSFYVKNNKLTFVYNAEGKTVEVTSNKTISKGKHQLRYEFQQNFNVPKGADKGDLFGSLSRDKIVSLYIDNEKVGEQKFELGLAYHATEGLDVGQDFGSAVTAAYKAPFTFTGKINHVVIEVLSKK
jgi:arylsulfatase